MQKDSLFWACMVFNMLFLSLLVAFKASVHLLPPAIMYVIIKLELISQIGLGFFALWKSVDTKLFSYFTKIYGILFLMYIILKLPFLNYLNEYYIVVPGIFSPFPFVLGWIINKAFYNTPKSNQAD